MTPPLYFCVAKTQRRSVGVTSSFICCFHFSFFPVSRSLTGCHKTARKRLLFNPLPLYSLTETPRCAAQGERFKSVASNILNSSIAVPRSFMGYFCFTIGNIQNSSPAVPRSIAGCCTQQNIGEMARSDGGAENSLSSAGLY